MTTSRRNVVELAEISEKVSNTPELVKSLNETITELNFILRSLTLNNLDGSIITATLLAGVTTRINHRLKLIPKYRVILRQVGGGVITDLNYSKEWIELKNNGTSDAEITIFIAKG